MIIWAWGPIEADFLRYYKLDLNELAFNNIISWRKFSILLSNLPIESSFMRWYKNKDNRDLMEMDENEISKNISGVGKHKRKS